MELVYYPDPLLRSQSKPVQAVTQEHRLLMDKMAQLLDIYEGAGIAAPQVGISQRIIVIKNDSDLLKLVNPEIAHGSDHYTQIEGCLSLPDIFVEITRDYSVVVKGLDHFEKKLKSVWRAHRHGQHNTKSITSMECS